ncbi:MAG: TRAP transporter small permease [Pseudomonadota bacterium]
MKKIVQFLNKIEEWTLVLVLLGLAFMTFIEVICRYILGFSFTWTEEVGRYMGVFVTFLGASLGVKYGSHFSMDLLYEKVSNDRLLHGLRVTVALISGVFFVIVAYYGWVQTMKLHTFGTVTAVFQFPKYWAYLPIPFFSLIMSIRFFAQGTRHLKSLIRNDPYKLPSVAS